MHSNPKPCNNWAKEGQCKFGDKCHFSHDNDGGGNSNPNSGGGRPFVPKGNFGNYGNNSGGGGDQGGQFRGPPRGPPGPPRGPPGPKGPSFGNNFNRLPFYSGPYSKEKREKPYDPNQKQNFSEFCKFFRQGTCNRENCKLKHTWTDTDDINLIHVIDFGSENPNDPDFGVRDVCLINKNDKLFGFSFPRKIEFYNFTTKIKQSKIFNENEEITTLKYFNDYLILGVNELENSISEVRLLFSDGREITISPAHQDSITDILLYKEYLVSSSFDGKIKFWKWDGTSSKFIIAYSHVLQLEITKLKYEFLNGKDLMFVVCSNQTIFVFEIKEGIDKNPNLFFIFELKNHHEKLITNLIIQRNEQNIFLITCSMDQTIKFHNLVDNNSFNTPDLGTPITCMEIATNNKDKDLLVVGFINGNVILYELSNSQEIGKLIIHKGASITNIISLKDKVNDVGIYHLLVADSQGRCSFWCFQKAKK